MRVGSGHDTHRLAVGRPLVLGGVRAIPISCLIAFLVGLVEAGKLGGGRLTASR